MSAESADWVAFVFSARLRRAGWGLRHPRRRAGVWLRWRGVLREVWTGSPLSFLRGFAALGGGFATHAPGLACGCGGLGCCGRFGFAVYASRRWWCGLRGVVEAL